MKSNKSSNLKSNLGTFLLIFFAIGLLINFSGCGHEYIIDNPYEKVNWDEYGRFKADLHSHTTRSDGHFSPHLLVDSYHNLGYDILAITDHNLVTYPWQEFSFFEASAGTYRRWDAGRLNGIHHEDVFVYENRDPGVLGMIAIQGNEVSQHHHLGSYFNDHPGGTLETVAETLEAIDEKDGLAVLFHPGSYDGTHTTRSFHPIDWYIDLFNRYDNLIGMEAYNNGLQHQWGNIHRWDSTLTRLMPERQVWSFSNDDFHGGIMGRTWNVFLLPELSHEEVRSAMEDGMFYFIYAPLGHDGPAPSAINSITINSGKGTIHIDASDYQYIEWISDGVVIYIGDKINLSDFPDINTYVRASIYQSKYGSVTHTQPFGVRRH